MKTVGIDTFTQFQINKLLAVANQCPLSGGDGVSKARSLYSLVDPLVKYDDGALCAPAPEARPQQADPAAYVTKNFQIIPNPAKDEIHLQFTQPLDENVQFVICDAQGRIQKMQQLESGQAIFSINIGHLPVGLYYCKLLDSETKNESHKLVIIR